MDQERTGRLTMTQFSDYLTRENSGSVKEIMGLLNSIAKASRAEGGEPTVSFVDVRCEPLPKLHVYSSVPSSGSLIATQ